MSNRFGGLNKYELIEQALMKIYDDGKLTATANDVARMTYRLSPQTVAAVLKFTNGIKSAGYKKGEWVFTGEPIRVMRREQYAKA